MNDDAQPTRVIIRSMTEFLLRAVQAKAQPLGDDLLAMVVYATIQNANLGPLLREPADARRLFDGLDRLDDDQLRPVSINSIAKSFGIPYETARNASIRLMGRGACLKVRGGVIVPAKTLTQPEMVAAERTVSMLLDDTLSRLGAIGLDFAQIAALGGAAEPATVSGPANPLHVSWIAFDFMLRTVETFAPIFGDFTASLIFLGVMAANTRDITYDPVRAWNYAGMDTPPPDRLRKPVSIRSLADQLGVPFETTRRHVNKMVKEAMLVRLDDGVIAPTEVMQSQRFLGHSPMIALRFTRMIAQLKRAGYVFPQPNVVVARNATTGAVTPAG